MWSTMALQKAGWCGSVSNTTQVLDNVVRHWVSRVVRASRCFGLELLLLSEPTQVLSQADTSVTDSWNACDSIHEITKD